MDLYEVFSSPFTLREFNVIHEPIPQIKTEFKTNDIFGETTKEEIYILSKMYFDQLILEYKNYIIDGQQTTESSYKLSVGIHSNDELNFKHIYIVVFITIWKIRYPGKINMTITLI